MTLRSSTGAKWLYAGLFLLLVIVIGILADMRRLPAQKQELQAERAQAAIEDLPVEEQEAQPVAALTPDQSPEPYRDTASAVQDEPQDVRPRQQALLALLARSKTMQPREMNRHIGELSQIIEDPSEPLSVSIPALHLMSDMLLVMKERGLSKDGVFRDQADMLVDLASDSGRNAHLRGLAIRTLGDLGIEEALPIARDLCANKTVWAEPELIRPACLTLGQLGGKAAIPVLVDILDNASLSSVYGTAAYTLGQFKSEETMVALARCRDRFPGTGSCDVSLEKMDAVIFDVLSQPHHPHVPEAIAATRALYSPEHIDQSMPLLKDILTTGSLFARREALDRILEIIRASEYSVVQRELREVLPLIENQPELRDEAEGIRLRLSAVPLMPVSRTNPDQ